MSKVTLTGTWDDRDRHVLVVSKSRGKLTLEDIQGALKDNNHYGSYVIILRVSEDGYQGWGDEPAGDAIDVYEIDASCPVCAADLSGHCPHCGKALNDI